jgi:serine/threonine protein kinase
MKRSFSLAPIRAAPQLVRHLAVHAALMTNLSLYLLWLLSLSHTHTHITIFKVMHRDVKPSNVLVRGRGVPGLELTLVDFGLAEFHRPVRSQLTFHNRRQSRVCPKEIRKRLLLFLFFFIHFCAYGAVFRALAFSFLHT